MRIISGKYKGKKLEGFDILGTRPTMDRVKESLMAMIQKYIKESIVLDLFAGSGSLGLETISNGSKTCYLVDNNIKMIEILTKNAANMSEDINILNLDYKVALKKFKESGIKFDIIFLDPPYKLNLINNCLELIYEYKLLNEDGIVVLEYEDEIINNEKFNILKTKKYGSKNIQILECKVSL